MWQHFRQSVTAGGGRMIIDEAIAHEREVAKEKRKEMQCKTCKLFARSDLHPLQGYCRKNEFRSIEIDSWSKVCSEYVPKEMCKCAEEHEQLAEWLKRAEKEKCARWTLEKHLGLDILFCSNCGRDLNCNDYGEYYIEHFKYCPYCGAKMELKGGGK